MNERQTDLTVQLFDDNNSDKPEPIELFQAWLAEAQEAEVNDANAMSLATVDGAGMPDCRIVLLKGLSDQGFEFYTNTKSAKGDELADNPVACLLFHWKSSRRQVRIRGTVETVSSQEADAYFATRPRGSQIGAHASDQSRPLKDRQTMTSKIEQLNKTYADNDVPRPDHWSGYRVVPQKIEFWQNGEFRLHDRITFVREHGAVNWSISRLYP